MKKISWIPVALFASAMVAGMVACTTEEDDPVADGGVVGGKDSGTADVRPGSGGGSPGSGGGNQGTGGSAPGSGGSTSDAGADTGKDSAVTDSTVPGDAKTDVQADAKTDASVPDASADTGSSADVAVDAPAADECDTCVESACAAVFKTCNDNAACLALISCVQACPDNDDACVQGCLTTNANGKKDYYLALACGTDACHDECFGTGCALAVTDPADPDCEDCLGVTTCATQCSDCDRNDECYAFQICAADCGQNATCQGSCGTLLPAGAALFTAFDTCSETSCGTVCN